MTKRKPGSIVVGAIVAVVGFVVLYFGAPHALAGFCAEHVSGWARPSMVCEFLGR
jgi:hypothetical protein